MDAKKSSVKLASKKDLMAILLFLEERLPHSYDSAMSSAPMEKFYFTRGSGGIFIAIFALRMDTALTTPKIWITCQWYTDERSLLIPPVGRFSVQLIIEVEHSDRRQQILLHLAHLFESQIMADVKFLVKDEEVGAHVVIAVSASPVMAAMLQPDKFKEGLTRTVHINDMEPSVFKELLRYVYTGKVLKLEQNGEPLFVTADRLQIQPWIQSSILGLKDLCTENLIQQLDLNNAVRYLVLGHLHSVPQLLEASLQYLERNKKELWARSDWKHLTQSYPELF